MQTKTLLLTIGAVGLLTAPSNAASLLLDFGTGSASSFSGVATETEAEKTPGYLSHLGEKTYNYGNSATLSSLKYGDNSDATGISVKIAAESTIGNNTINFASGPALNFASVTGSAISVPGSAYSGNSPARQSIFRNSSGGGDNSAMGVSITGLAAGTYTIFMVGRNTNAGSTDTPANFYLSTVNGGMPSSYLFAGEGNTTQQTAGATHTSASLNGLTFTAGVTHVEFTVTLTENQTLLLASEGTGNDEMRGFINSIEIVQVPEPSAAILSFGTIGLLALRRRRSA